MIIKIVISIILWMVFCCSCGLFKCYVERNYSFDMKREFINGFMYMFTISGTAMVLVGCVIGIILLWK